MFDFIIFKLVQILIDTNLKFMIFYERSTLYIDKKKILIH